ncbi:MAG: PHP domain-containing protein [Promethearchaeota archaeon]
MKLTLDSHVHTRFSDGTIFYNGLSDLKALKKKHGFNAFTITDHNTTRGIAYARRACKILGVPFIPGVEISAKEGHVVAYGIDRWEIGAYKLTLMEVLEKLDEQNAVKVIAHPFDGRMGIGNLIFKKEVQKQIDGFEIFNGASPQQNLKCTIKARDLPKKFPMFSGSDCHSHVLFYKYHVEIEVDSTSLEDILEAMRNKYAVRPVGPIIDIFNWIGDFVPAEIGRKQIKKLKRLESSSD